MKKYLALLALLFSLHPARAAVTPSPCTSDGLHFNAYATNNTFPCPKISQSGSSSSGFLSSTDWNTFNGKQNSFTVTSPITYGGSAIGFSSSATLSNNTTGTAANVSGIVAVANGGTGTTTPSLVQGSNVTITGSWPNQTIAASGGTPGGSPNAIQWNDAGSFDGFGAYYPSGSPLGGTAYTDLFGNGAIQFDDSGVASFASGSATIDNTGAARFHGGLYVFNNSAYFGNFPSNVLTIQGYNDGSSSPVLDTFSGSLALNGDGSASFAHGSLTIDSSGGLQITGGSNLNIYNSFIQGNAFSIGGYDGHVSFDNGAITSDGSGNLTAASFITTGGTSSQFVKGNGSLDSTTYLSGVVSGANGGTGVANTGHTITIGSNVTMSGAYSFTGTLTGATSVTFPTSGTLSTLSSLSGTSPITYNSGTGAIGCATCITSAVTSLNTLTGALSITSPNSTLSIGTSGSNVTSDINLAHANTWTATQTFSNGTYSALFTGGNVGIGTATPTAGLHFYSTSGSSSLNAKLVVQSNGNNWGQVQIANPSASEASLAYVPNATNLGTFPPTVSSGTVFNQGVGLYSIGGDYYGIGNANIGAVAFQIYKTGDVIITQSTGGQDAGYRLDVQRSGTNGTARIYDQTATTGSTHLLIQEGAGQSTNEAFGVYANNGTTPRLVVEGGNVGIGTASPANALDVYSGGLHIGSNTPSNTTAALYNAAGTLTWAGNPVGTITSVATTSPITGGTITTTGTIACATCVTASSPGAGIAHFAGSTQAVTSSAVSLTADVSGILPVANGGNGTASPALSNGTGITLSGSWPSYTITNSEPYTGVVTLGTSTSATNPQRSGEANTGLYTAGSGLVDFASLGTQTVEISSAGLNLAQLSEYYYIDAFQMVSLGNYIHKGNNNFTIAIGPGALSNYWTSPNTANGSFDIAIGQDALGSETTGSSNIAIGYWALNGSTTSNGNVAIGVYALSGNGSPVTGINNMAVGGSALVNNTSGSNNMGFGSAALSSVTVGSANIGVGFSSGGIISSGSNNIAIGYDVGVGTTEGCTATGLQTGSNDILIGTDCKTGPPTTSTNNFLSISSVIFGTDLYNNGNTGANPKIGINTNAPSATLHIVSKATGTVNEIVQEIASQTADMVDWENSSSSILASISSSGLATAANFIDNGVTANTLAYYNGSKQLSSVTLGTGFTLSTGTLACATCVTSASTWTQGDILYYNGSNWVDLAAGTSGYFLETQGASANPVWASASGSGTVNAATQYQIPYYSSSGSAAVLSGHSQLSTDSNYDLFASGGLGIGTTSLLTGTGVELGYKNIVMGPTPYAANYVSGCTACAYFDMDENASSNDVQIILRDQGNARATIGLVGDNNIHFQTVSGTYLSEAFSDRIVILGTGSAAPGNVGIGTTNPAALLSVGTNSDVTIDYVGNLTTDSTVSAVNPSGNGVITASGQKTSGNGAGFRIRNGTDGTIGYYGADSYITGGTAYHQLDIQAAQSDGIVSITGGGNSTGGITVGSTDQVAIGTTTMHGQFSISNASSHAGQATCWTTSGQIGYCTGVVGATGACSCTGL